MRERPRLADRIIAFDNTPRGTRERACGANYYHHRARGVGDFRYISISAVLPFSRSIVRSTLTSIEPALAAGTGRAWDSVSSLNDFRAKSAPVLCKYLAEDERVRGKLWREVFSQTRIARIGRMDKSVRVPRTQKAPGEDVSRSSSSLRRVAPRSRGGRRNARACSHPRENTSR